MATNLQVQNNISSTPQYVQDASANNSSLVISSGNTGVGTSSPADKLDVRGNVRVTNTADAYPVLQILNYDHDNVSLCFDSYWDGSWKSSDSGSNYRIYKVDDHLRFSYASGVSQGQVIWDWTGSATGGCVLDIDSNAQVGIGTYSPQAKLDVRGSAIFNEDGGDNDFRVEGDTDANLLVIDASADKVGIGTSAPASKLSVAGSLSIGSSYAGNSAPSNGVIIEGNVGIGTTSPNAAALLQLDSTTKGFLLPRMTTQQMNNISSPPAGLLIYNTTAGGLYYYTGSAWSAV